MREHRRKFIGVEKRRGSRLSAVATAFCKALFHGIAAAVSTSLGSDM